VAATARPKALGLPFTRWSVRKLATYLAGDYRHVQPGTGLVGLPDRRVRIGRERLRQLLADAHITFGRTRTWKESTDPDFDAKLDRIEHVTSRFPDRCFAFDQFGPLSVRPHHGSGWARSAHPDRLPATYRRTHGIRYFHGCYSLGEDKLWGVVRRRKGGDHTLAALRSIRATRPDGAPIYVIPEYVPRNIFRVLFPSSLCAGPGGRGPVAWGSGAVPAVVGHITLAGRDRLLPPSASGRELPRVGGVLRQAGDG
jgi:hypothetical protein